MKGKIIMQAVDIISRKRRLFQKKRNLLLTLKYRKPKSINQNVLLMDNEELIKKIIKRDF